MRFFITAILFACVSSLQAQTGEVKIIIPNPPGSSSDVVARSLQEGLKLRHNIEMIIDYKPGAEHVIAAQNFVHTDQFVLSLGSTTMHVFNPVFKTSLPYQDKDFDHIVWIGQTPHVWLVREDSSIKNIKDLLFRLKQRTVTVGVDGLSTQINVTSVRGNHKNGHNITMIPYKGSPQSITDLLGGHIDVVVASVSSVIIEHIENGSLHALGTTNSKNQVIGTKHVPMASTEFGVPQFNGGFLISAKPNFNRPDLKRAILDVIKSRSFQEKMSKINITTDILVGEQVTEYLSNYRSQVRRLQ